MFGQLLVQVCMDATTKQPFDYKVGPVTLGAVIAQEKHDKPASAMVIGHQVHTSLSGCQHGCKGSTERRPRPAGAPRIGSDCWIEKTAAKSKAANAEKKRRRSKQARVT